MKQFFINLLTSNSGISSKRFAGLLLLVGSLLLCLISIIFGVLFKYEPPQGFWYFLGACLTSACALFGVTAYEKKILKNIQDETNNKS